MTRSAFKVVWTENYGCETHRCACKSAAPFPIWCAWCAISTLDSDVSELLEVVYLMFLHPPITVCVSKAVDRMREGEYLKALEVVLLCMC